MKLLSLGFCFLSSNFQRRYRFYNQRLLHVRTMTTPSSSADAAAPNKEKTYEVEQKFGIGDIEKLKERLTHAGFAESSCKEMVDWYFDVPTSSFPLLRQDCWLRYRSVSSTAQWELKRGRPKSETQSKATVYEEIEGNEALWQSKELIAAFVNANGQSTQQENTHQKYDNNDDDVDEEEIPQPPVEIDGLTPFARIATQRSTWRSETTDWVVDLDVTTNFEHAVGEVETVVSDPALVPAAQDALQTWLEETLLQGEAPKGPPPMGKLEFYLSTRRPEILEILLEAGLVPNRS